MPDQFPLNFGSHNRTRTKAANVKTLPLLNDSVLNSSCLRKIEGKRETWRISVPEGTFYIKISFNNSLFRTLLSVLWLSKLQKEIRAFRVLKTKDILIPELISYGNQYGALRLPKREYIITKEIENSLRLKDFYFDTFLHLSRKNQKQLISDFASYIRRLHDGGIMHLDPNLGNFLIKQEKYNKNLFYILDLADVKVKKALNLSERYNNLALINLNFFRSVSVSLRYYFLENYARGLLFRKADVIEAVKIIEDQALNLANKTWGIRIKRCLENNNFFAAFKKVHLKVHIKKDCNGHDGIKDVLSSPDVFLDNGKAVIFKDGRTVKAARIDTGNGISLFLKRYNKKGFLHTFKNIFRSSRARRVWINSYGFELRNIPIGSPLAYMEERIFRILKRSYVVSEFITDAVALSSIFRSFANNYREQTMAIMQMIGSEIGSMHRLGCVHGDLKWSNILIKEIDGKYRCFFVDLDGSQIKRRLSLSEIIDELSRFYVETLKYALDSAEQEAFLKAYCKNNHLRISYKELLIKINKKSTSDFEGLKSRS